MSERFVFASRAELEQFLLWPTIIQHVCQDQSSLHLVVCPCPSELTKQVCEQAHFISGSHRQEIDQFFERQTNAILESLVSMQIPLQVWLLDLSPSQWHMYSRN